MKYFSSCPGVVGADLELCRRREQD